MSAPTVSVILPTYNRSSTLPRSINSVLHQSYSDFELIIVDDASTEDVKSVVSTFGDKRIRYIRRDSCGGPAAARNTGIRQARGKYLAFQDSDDEWLLEKLDRQVKLIEAQPKEVALIGCGIVGYREGSKVLPFPDPKIRSPKDSNPVELMSCLAYAYTQTWLLRLEVLAETDLFDETINIWEDRDLFVRIAMRHQISYLPEVLVITYRQSDSISSQLLPRISSLERLLEKYSDGRYRDRRLLAWLAYLLARARLEVGNTRDARRDLLHSLRFWPWSVKPMTVLLLTFSRCSGGGRIKKANR